MARNEALKSIISFF